ncbi:MAG TPA: protein-L-isoaspartate(D-aspartate) O-methyltransferase [Candidatus Eisenbacteria bacterium]|nr:protein-L-isoaspartate(D-aspartate) O-methyltransferase [Candidatus Eisenbacteria bacterium]
MRGWTWNRALVFLTIAVAAPAANGCTSRAATPGDSLESQRAALVRSIEANGVRDSVTLAALRAVPRHEFVPEAYRRYAYLDRPLPIGHEQTISQPYIVAFMTEAIRPRRGLKVLEIGTGSGYQAAVLAQTGARVWSIEIIRALADEARARLEHLGYRDIHVRHGDGYRGWPEEAPFDAILLTAAPDSVPSALIEQLGPGGRLVAPIGPEGEDQELVLVEKDARGVPSRRVLLPVRFVPMRKDVR